MLALSPVSPLSARSLRNRPQRRFGFSPNNFRPILLKNTKDSFARNIVVRVQGTNLADAIEMREVTGKENEDEGKIDRDMAPLTGNSIHRSSSRPQLDFSKAAIQGNSEDTDPTMLLPDHSDDISHLALDIGGSLIKLVNFSRHEDRSIDDKIKKIQKERFDISNANGRSYPVLGGWLHLVKLETHKIDECLDFISSKQLHRVGMDSHSLLSKNPSNDSAVIKATWGGAYKFADLFKERLGVCLDKEDEMDCLVAGANFVLKTIPHEAFTHTEGQKEFIQLDHDELFPYLLVNIGSGVSIIKVDGDGKFERVSGTSIGGGTYLNLGMLLTECKSFDELLELSQRGDNRNVDMLVGDICGGSGYNKISHLLADKYGIKRIFFGGFFIRGHPYTMDMLSYAVNYWSKGKMQAMFLQHEGFLGALGALRSYEKHGLDDSMAHQLVKRFPMVHGPQLGDLTEKRKGNEWSDWPVNNDRREVLSEVSKKLSDCDCASIQIEVGRNQKLCWLIGGFVLGCICSKVLECNFKFISTFLKQK